MTNIGGVSAQELRSFIERIETLETEKTEVSEQIREVMAHAKSEGFDIPTIRQVLKMRKMKREDLIEREELIDLYCNALGMNMTVQSQEAV